MDEKDKKEKKDKVEAKVPASELAASLTEYPAMESRLAAALASVPTRGSVGAKASSQSKLSIAKNPALEKLKGSMPTKQLGETPASKIVLHTSLMGVKLNNKEVVSIPFWHVPCQS